MLRDSMGGTGDDRRRATTDAFTLAASSRDDNPARAPSPMVTSIPLPLARLRELPPVSSRLATRGHPHAMKLSAVVPAHNEEASIRPTLTSLAETLEGAGIDYELLAVDDSSTDGTADAISA